MKTGKAVLYRDYGGFEVVEVTPLDRPVAAEGEVVVRVSAAGLNHIERFVREGQLRDLVTTRFPSGQGVDFAGVVESVGAGVRTPRKGDEVVGHLPGSGTHATWISVPASAVVPKPATVPVEVAGGLYLAGTTALAIVDRLRLGPDDTVVITAAAGGVGHIQVQIAQRLGATVIALGSAGNHDFLRQIGAHPVVYGEGEEDRIREAADGRPVTAFLDNHGSGEELAAKLGVPDDRLVRSDERRDVEIRFLTASADDAQATSTLARMLGMVADHQIVVLISGFYPFDFVAEAYQDLARMHSRGKVVLGMDPVESGARQGWYLSETARAFSEQADAARRSAGMTAPGSAGGGPRR